MALGFELALGLPPSPGSPLRVGLALPVAVGAAVLLGPVEGDAEGAPGAADEGEAVGCADPPHATATVSPCSAPTTSAKSVLTVTGSLICFPGFAAHLPSTFTLATARPAPSAVIVAFSLFASGSANELSTGDVADASPTFTLTFFVTDGPSEKDSPRRETSIVCPSLTGSEGRVTPMEDFAARGLRPGLAARYELNLSRSRLSVMIGAPPAVRASNESPPESRKVTEPTVYLRLRSSGFPLTVTDVMRLP